MPPLETLENSRETVMQMQSTTITILTSLLPQFLSSCFSIVRHYNERYNGIWYQISVALILLEITTTGSPRTNLLPKQRV